MHLHRYFPCYGKYMKSLLVLLLRDKIFWSQELTSTLKFNFQVQKRSDCVPLFFDRTTICRAHPLNVCVNRYPTHVMSVYTL